MLSEERIGALCFFINVLTCFLFRFPGWGHD